MTWRHALVLCLLSLLGFSLLAMGARPRTAARARLAMWITLALTTLSACSYAMEVSA